MYPDEGGGGAPAEPYYPSEGGIKSKIKYNLEGIIPLILIIIIVAFLGHKFGIWTLPFLGGTEPMEMLIIGEPSFDLERALNDNRDLVRWHVMEPSRLRVNPRDIIAQYDIVMLNQHNQTNKEVTRQLGEAIQEYVTTGGKFILVQDSGIRREGAADILGWKASFGDIVPVTCERVGTSTTPSCLDERKVSGRIVRDDFDHPIMKGIEFAPAEEGYYLYLETFPVLVDGWQVAYIESSAGTREIYPAIVEKRSLIVGKSLYFGYDPGKTRGILEETLKYLR